MSPLDELCFFSPVESIVGTYLEEFNLLQGDTQSLNK